MPAPFDFPLLPTGLPVVASGVSTGGDTVAPQMGNVAGSVTATGTSDFASLLSGVLAPANPLAPATPQTGLAQSGLPGAAPDAGQGTVAPAITANNPTVPPVNTTLLQAQLPAVDSAPVNATLVTPAIAPQAVIVPQDNAQAVLPELVSAQAAATETAAQVIPAQVVPVEGITSEVPPAKPAQTQSVENLAVEVPVVKVPVIDAPVPAMAQAEVAVPVSQAEPKASPEAVQAPAPVMAAAPAEPLVMASVVAEAPIETAPVIAPPAIKTAEAKPAKSKPAETETGKTTVQTDESAGISPDAASLAVAASAVVPVTAPVVQTASQPVIAGSDDAPAPAGKQTPAAPQAPAPQNRADAADDGMNAPADKTQASAKPNFAGLLTAAPTLSAGAAAVKPQAPATTSAPIASTPVASTPVASTPATRAPVQADAPAPQTTQAGEAAPAQKSAVQSVPVQNAPVQNAPVQTTQIQMAQAQVTQAQATQSATRKPVSAPAENITEIASTPVAAAPSGFSLVSTPVTSDATYTPAATPQAPATSLLSQTAVDNINALSVQINRRNAEGATKFTMELHPADLGKVDVALSIGRDGKMTAHMTFDSDMTKAAFSAHESDLRQQLSATGLKLSDDALSFSTRQKTDAVAQAQSQAVNANARSADDSSSGNSSQQQQPQNAFTQADSQQGQQRPHSQHLAQMASRQAAADQAAMDADLEALNSAIDASAARLNYRQSASRLALDLSV